MDFATGIDGWLNLLAGSVACYGCDESGDIFRFLALVEVGRHVAEALRGTFEDRGQDERLARRRVEISWPTRTSRFGPIRPTDLTAASVWQTVQVEENSSRPFTSSAFRCTPPGPSLALSLALCASTSAGTTRPKTNASTTASVIRRWLAFDSAGGGVCEGLSELI